MPLTEEMKLRQQGGASNSACQVSQAPSSTPKYEALKLLPAQESCSFRGEPRPGTRLSVTCSRPSSETGQSCWPEQEVAYSNVCSLLWNPGSATTFLDSQQALVRPAPVPQFPHCLHAGDATSCVES